MKKKQNIVAFDILGPMYSYGEDGTWQETEQGALKDLLIKIEKEGYKPKTLAEESAIEEEMLNDGRLTPYITPGFVESVLHLKERGILPVIVSAGTYESFDMSLESAVKEYRDRTKEVISVNNLFQKEHRHSVIEVGSKKDPKTWKDIIKQNYGDSKVHITYEDTLANLNAAMDGLDCYGFHVISQSKSIKRLDNKLFKGTMTELMPQFKEILGAW